MRKTHLLWPAVALGIASWAQAHVTLPAAAPPTAPASAPASSAPPFDLLDPARIAAGKVRFGSTCAAYCHGREGEGGKTPPFKGRTDLTPESTFKTISEGRRGTDVMPPWGNAFSQEEIWELVAYIQALGRQARPQ